jgi:membrane protease YdiL (CAAX protease family)
MTPEESKTQQVSSTSQYYGVSSSLLLLAAWIGMALVLELVQRAASGSLDFSKTVDYGSIFSTILVICFVMLDKPALLGLSRWRIRWMDVCVAAPLAVLVQATPLFFVADAREYFYPATTPYVFLSWSVICMPILEEMFCRGILLKSLKVKLPRILAVAILSTLVAAGHPVFIEALPRQILLCFVYLALGDSICASIIAHVVLNGFVALPLASFFQRLHIYTLWH